MFASTLRAQSCCAQLAPCLAGTSQLIETSGDCTRISLHCMRMCTTGPTRCPLHIQHLMQSPRPAPVLLTHCHRSLSVPGGGRTGQNVIGAQGHWRGSIRGQQLVVQQELPGGGAVQGSDLLQRLPGCDGVAASWAWLSIAGLGTRVPEAERDWRRAERAVRSKLQECAGNVG
jgi:hypothetical protein